MLLEITYLTAGPVGFCNLFLFLYKHPEKGSYKTHTFRFERLMCVRWSFLGGVNLERKVPRSLMATADTVCPHCQVGVLEGFSLIHQIFKVPTRSDAD